MHVFPGRPTRTVTVSLAAVGAAVALVGVPASGVVGTSAGGRYQTASLTFAESAPGRPTAMRVRIDYVNPDDPRAKPPSVRRVVEVFARGTDLDTSAPARCRATDAQLMLQGRSACPRASVVGHGFIRLDTGIPRPGRFLREDVTFLNNTDQLIYLVRDRATGARTAFRARVEGRRVVTQAPLLPGAPPDGTAVDVVRAHFPRLVRVRDGQRRAFLTTPRHCPARGYWVNRVRFSYRDGTVQVESTRNPCTR
jgi:hypothetical protein